MKFRLLLIWILWSVAVLAQTKSNPSQYNVVWTSPSDDSSGSMPVGNGDIGLNVWVEKSGDILFLIGKTDAFDENARLVKICKARIKLFPSPFISDTSFRQVLNLQNSSVEISAGSKYRIKIWVDANRPVIHVETEGDHKFVVSASLESWRSAKVQMKDTQVSDLFKNLSGPDKYPTWIFPDNYKQNTDNQVILYHRNVKPENDGYEINMKLQGLGEYMKQVPHPLMNNVFGAMMSGDGFVSENDRILKSARSASKQRIEIVCLTVKNCGEDRWLDKLKVVKDSCAKVDRNTAWRQHLTWWNSFWNRSWIEMNTFEPKSSGAVKDLSRAYQLCRYMSATASRGEFPIKFNGSIYSYGKTEDPDYRRWGGSGFWFQNQRLAYWPMLAQGDFDMMNPWFNFYHNVLPLEKYRTKTFFNHEGAFFAETITPWGSSVSAHYGWTPFEERKNKADECTYTTFYWQNGIEQLLMMVEYFNYTRDEEFARNILVPHAIEILKFYDLHYQTDNRGRIVFAPAQSLETYQVAVNPMPEVAGLNYTIKKLLALPENVIGEVQKKKWIALLKQLPPIPVGVRENKRALLFAETWAMKMNIENPELYAVFPYRIYGLGKDSIQLARNAFEIRVHKADECWYQNVVDAALLGIDTTAQRMILERAKPSRYSHSRFPAFWNAFNDWVPDVDHGGNLELALTYMLLQCEGKEIRLLPCWPKLWDVSFKLHAPYNTTIECVYKNGKIESLKVTPESRRNDLIFTSN